MSSTVTNSFTEEWNASATHELQQWKSNLRNNVRVKKTNGSSNVVHFGVIGSGTATSNRARHTDLTPMNLAHSDVSLTLTNLEAPEWIDSFDRIKTNQDLQAEYTTAITGAINRGLEGLIITALDAGTNSVTTAAMDKAGILLMHKTLNDAIVPMNDRFLVVGSGGLNDMLSDTTITSRDYIENEALKNGFVPNVLGFKVIYMEDSSLLPSNTAGKKNHFAFQKQAVGLGMGKDMQILTERIAHKNLTQVLGVMAAGSVVILPNAVCYAEISN